VVQDGLKTFEAHDGEANPQGLFDEGHVGRGDAPPVSPVVKKFQRRKVGVRSDAEGSGSGLEPGALLGGKKIRGAPCRRGATLRAPDDSGQQEEAKDDAENAEQTNGAHGPRLLRGAFFTEDPRVCPFRLEIALGGGSRVL